MNSSTSIVRSVTAVAASVAESQYGLTRSEGASVIDSQILSSIEAMETALARWRRHASLTGIRAKRSVLEVSSRFLSVTADPGAWDTSTPSFLSPLRRAHSENLHSDWLAALLRTGSSPSIAQTLFEVLYQAGRASGEAPLRRHSPTRYVFSYREVRLDSMLPRLEGRDLGARRLDILARRGKQALVIESKMWTGESADQTRDYADAVEEALPGKHLSFLLLSPDGSRARDSRFRSISYFQLFEHLVRLHGVSSPPPILTAYVDELERTFVLPRRRQLDRTRGISSPNRS